MARKLNHIANAIAKAHIRFVAECCEAHTNELFNFTEVLAQATATVAEQLQLDTAELSRVVAKEMRSEWARVELLAAANRV